MERPRWPLPRARGQAMGLISRGYVAAGRDHLTRRHLVACSLALAATPRPAWAQASRAEQAARLREAAKIWRIGVLGVGMPGVGVIALDDQGTTAQTYLPRESPQGPRNASEALYINWFAFVVEL